MSVSIQATPPVRGAAIGIALSSFAYFFFLGTATPYFSLWLAEKALDARWIAAVATALLIGATIGQAALPSAALWIGRAPMLAIAALGALASTAMLLLCRAPAALVGLALLSALFTGAAIPLIDALALEVASRWYGRIRAAGSAGFAIATLSVGWSIDRLGVTCVVPIEVASLACLLGAACFVAVTQRSMPRRIPAPGGTGWLHPLRSGWLWGLMLAVALINAGHAYYYTFGNLHWSRDLGYASTTLGLLWATGVVAEISIFAGFGDRGGPRSAFALMLAGAVGGVIRWSFTAFDPPLAVLFALQLLHGLSFAATLLGGLRMVKLTVSDDVAPLAIGVFAAMVHGVVIGIVTACLGARTAQDPQAAYLGMAALSAAGGIGVLLLAPGIRPRAGRLRA